MFLSNNSFKNKNSNKKLTSVSVVFFVCVKKSCAFCWQPSKNFCFVGIVFRILFLQWMIKSLQSFIDFSPCLPIMKFNCLFLSCPLPWNELLGQFYLHFLSNFLCCDYWACGSCNLVISNIIICGRNGQCVINALDWVGKNCYNNGW